MTIVKKWLTRLRKNVKSIWLPLYGPCKGVSAESINSASKKPICKETLDELHMVWIVRLVRYIPSLDDPNTGRFRHTSLIFHEEPTREMIDDRLTTIFGYSDEDIQYTFVERIESWMHIVTSDTQKG